MAGRVEADAEYYGLPYDVLIGRDSEIITDYEIIKLPRLIIVAKDGTVAFTERFVPLEKLRGELERVRRE